MPDDKKPGLPAIVSDTGEALESQAQQLAGEQAALLQTASLQSRYGDALALCVEQKQAQAEAIEERLEALIEHQQALLQQGQAGRPGFLALPSARAAWQQRQAECQGRLQLLQARLERVHELHQGMGLYVPRIEELAARKLRAEQPELAAQWSLQRQAERSRQENRRQNQTCEPGRSRPMPS